MIYMVNYLDDYRYVSGWFPFLEQKSHYLKVRAIFKLINLENVSRW